MAVVGSLIVLLGTNNTALTAGLLKAEGQLKTFGATAGTTSAMTGTILAGVGLAAVAGMALAVNSAKNFQEQMAKVNTIAHLGEAPLAALGQEVRALSISSGVGVGDLTSGLYDLFSVGVPAGNAMEFLTNATTLSIGGLSTANEAVLGITTAINAWSGASGDANLTMNDSAKVMDIFAQAIAAGGMTAADIPAALANVASQAARMNMPLEEVGATWAILTTRGETASTAMTSLSAVLTALAKAPPGMEKLQKAFGKTYLEIAKTQGVHEAVMQVVADTEKLGLTFDEVWGRKEASAFVGFTTGAVGDALWTEALANAPGVGEAAGQMEERMGTLDAQLRILGTSVDALAAGLGTSLLPPLTTLVQTMSGAVQGANDWANANPGLSKSLFDLAPAVIAIGIALAVVGGPITIVAALLIAAVANMDKLVAGAREVQRLVGPQGAAQDFRTSFQAEHGRMPSPLEWGQYQAGTLKVGPQWGDFNTPGFGAGVPGSTFQGPPTPRGMGTAWGSFNSPGFHAGQAGSPFAGPPTPIQVNSTTSVVLDGEKVGSIVERRLYNSASATSSGFANPGPSPIR